jgi:hypothetical protein
VRLFAGQEKILTSHVPLPFNPKMNSEIKSLKKALQNRQSELKKLIDQMKSDQLNSSSLFRNLENELTSIRQRLEEEEPSDKK